MKEYEADRPPASSGSNNLLPFALAVLAGLTFLVVFVQSRPPSVGPGGGHPAVGTRLEMLHLEPLFTEARPLQISDLEGRVTLINYWGPWCGPCRIEMPHMIDLERKLRDHADFQLLSVSCGIGGAYRDLDELRSDTARFVENAGIEFPVYYDPVSKSQRGLVHTAGLEDLVYPTTVLLDREQTIQGLWPGYYQGLEKEIEAVVLGVLADR